MAHQFAVVTDVLALRSCLAMGALIGGANAATKQPVDRVNLGWATAFLIVNTVMIIKIMLERRELDFTSEELDVFESQFLPFGVTPRQVLWRGRFEECCSMAAALPQCRDTAVLSSTHRAAL